MKKGTAAQWVEGLWADVTPLQSVAPFWSWTALMFNVFWMDLHLDRWSFFFNVFWCVQTSNIELQNMDSSPPAGLDMKEPTLSKEHHNIFCVKSSAHLYGWHLKAVSLAWKSFCLSVISDNQRFSNRGLGPNNRPQDESRRKGDYCIGRKYKDLL